MNENTQNITKSTLQEEIYNVDKELELSNEAFHRKKRHIFVITDSGKPVYTRYGEESDLGPVIATFNVILHKLEYLNGKETKGVIRKIENDFTKTIFLKEKNLFCLYITKDKTENDFSIKSALKTLLHQITCSITGNYKEQLEENPNFNPGNNLPTHYQTLAWSLAASVNSFSSIFRAFSPFLISKNIRKKIKENMELFENEGIVFKQLMTPHNVITWDNEDFDLSSEDINAIFSLVNSKFKMQGVDYIMPYCVPSIAEKGYVNLYYRMIAKDIGVFLIFTDPNLVKECVEMCHKIEVTLEDEGLLGDVKKYWEMAPLTPFHFNLENLDQLVVFNTELKQYCLLGSLVYQKREDSEQKKFYDFVADSYSRYLKLWDIGDGKEEINSKKGNFSFEFYEKIDDFFVGVLKDKELLFFGMQRKWNDVESMRESLKMAVTVIRSDFENFFIKG